MEAIASKPAGHLRLTFDEQTAKQLASSLSAIEQLGPCLWLAGDEGTSIERLVSSDFANYGENTSFDLKRFFSLPGKKSEEIDLEGLSVDGDQLWLMGSHSYRRGVPKIGMSGADALARLANVDRQPNRFLLGRIRLRSRKNGVGDLVPESAASLPFGEDDSGLERILRKDRLIAPFLGIPSKDNGLDIEGLAVRNGAVYLGLRGPVLRGWAVVVQLDLRDDAQGTLKAEQFERTGRRHLTHILDLGGLGIRDLCVDGDDLLILAGPTMDLDGPASVFRWRDAFSADVDQCIDDHRLDRCFDLPTGFRSDHPEGLALFRRPEAAPCLAVVYDSPAQSRLHYGRYFEADLFALPT